MEYAGLEYQYSKSHDDGYKEGYNDALGQTSSVDIKLLFNFETSFFRLYVRMYTINVGLAAASVVSVRYNVTDQGGLTEGTGGITLSNVANGEMHRSDFSVPFHTGDISLRLNIDLSYSNQSRTYAKDISTLSIGYQDWVPD